MAKQNDSIQLFFGQSLFISLPLNRLADSESTKQRLHFITNLYLRLHVPDIAKVVYEVNLVPASYLPFFPANDE